MMIDFTRVDVNIPKLSMHHSDKHQNTPILRKDNYIELFCNVFPHLIGICPTLSTFLVSLCLFQYIMCLKIWPKEHILLFEHSSNHKCAYDAFFSCHCCHCLLR